MFTISNAAKGRASARYYLSLAREDYYSQGGEAPGEWAGSAAALLGLAGTVRPEHMTQIMDGFAPDGRALVQNAGHKRRRSLWDGTLSAPKSYSVAWGSSDGELRAAFERIHDHAVKQTVRALEEIVGQSRRGQGGQQLESAGLIVALFKHGTSRALDANLHTHVLIMNATSRPDGSFGSFACEDLFRHKMAIGALYRAELAHELRRTLGLSLRSERSWFELEGVPASLVAAHSQRRAAILEALKAYGEDNAVAAKAAAMATRQAKEVVPRAELFRRWRALAEEHGFNPARDLAKGLHAGRLDPDRALAEITKEHSYLSERDLLRKLAEQVQTGGATIAQIRAAARQGIEALIHVGRHRRERQYTTAAILRMEEKMIADAKRGRNTGRHRVPRWLTALHLPFAGLSKEQAVAVKELTTGRGSVQVVQGFAGTGKSKMLETARKIWHRDGQSVIGLALQGKAAAGLEQASGIRSMTLESFLMAFRPRSFDQVREDIKFKDEPWRVPGFYRQGQFRSSINRRMSIHRKTVLVVDEAGMLGTVAMKELLDLARSARAKVVLVGDQGQLPAIDAGGPFAALGKELGRSTLNEIQRQKEPWARKMVKDFAEGRTAQGLDALRKHGLVTVTDNVVQARQRLVDDWAKGSNREAIILAATRAEVKDLNQRAQVERTKQGLVVGPGLEVGWATVHRGDRVLFRKNSSTLGVSNGHLGTVVGVDRGLFKALRIRLDHDGREVRVRLKNYDHIELGYALTTHKAQGVTVDKTFVMGSEILQGREMTYVQVSRSRAETRLYLTKELAGEAFSTVAKQMRRSTAKELARDLAHDPVRGAKAEQERSKSQTHSTTKSHSHGHSL